VLGRTFERALQLPSFIQLNEMDDAEFM